MSFWRRLNNWWNPKIPAHPREPQPSTYRLWDSLNLRNLRQLAGCTEKAYLQLELSSLNTESLDELSRFVSDVETKIVGLERQVLRLRAKLDNREESPSTNVSFPWMTEGQSN